MDFLRVESYKKGIVISTFFNFIAKIVSMLNSVIVAYYFGTQSSTDVYFYVYATIGLMAAFLTNLSGLVLIPESMRIREQEGEKNAMYFLNFFIYIFIIFSLIITVILYIKPIETFTIFSKFNILLLKGNIGLMQLMASFFILNIIISFLTEVLISYKFFTLPMIAGMINSFFCTLFVFLFHNTLNVSSIALGILISSTVNIFLLVLMINKQIHWDFSFRIIKISRRTLGNLLYAEVGNISSVVGTYLPLYIISGFNQGIITALNYGKNLSNIPDQFFTAQFSSIFGIRLNEAFAKKQCEQVGEIFYKSMNVLLMILIPISFLMFICSTEAITIIYKRGRFNADSVKMTSEFFQYFSLTLPLLAVNTFLSRLFTAGQKIDVAFYSGLAINISYFIILYFFIDKIGPIGYPLAMLVYLPISLFGVNFYICKKYFPEVNYLKVIKLFFSGIFLNLVAGIPCWLFLKYILIGFNPVYIIIIVSTIYLGILFLILNISRGNKQYLELQNEFLIRLKILTK